MQNSFPGLEKRPDLIVDGGDNFFYTYNKRFWGRQAFLRAQKFNSNQRGGKMVRLSHFDREGRARMVDVSAKPVTNRVAVACGRVLMKAQTLERILNKEIEKGDVLGVARVAGIMAVKRTGEMIPMCHPLTIDSVEIQFQPDTRRSEVRIEVRVKSAGKTGVEIEALMATAVAALTIYDMCKAVDRGMTISDIQLMKKSGGKSGTYIRRE
jgi:cyclic pyranopterin phosphate synthase